MQVVPSRWGQTSSSDIYHCSSLFTAHSTHRALHCIPKLNKEKVLRKTLALIFQFHRWTEETRARTQLKGTLSSWLMLCPPDLALQVAASRELKVICGDTSKFCNDLGVKKKQSGWRLREQEVDWVGLAEPPSCALSKQLTAVCLNQFHRFVPK